MAFEKGRAKTGGRKKGTPNRTGAETKTRLEAIAAANIEKAEKELSELTGRDFLHFYLKILEYVLPKQKESIIDFSSLSEDEAETIIQQIIERLKNEN